MVRQTGAIRAAITVLTASTLMLAAAAQGQPIPIVERGLLPGDATVGIAANSQQDHAVARGGDQYLAVWSDYRSQAVGAIRTRVWATSSASVSMRRALPSI
ncbi:MAG: hypothetical protein E4H38_04945, partial [Gemmatimonadales bacterium]